MSNGNWTRRAALGSITTGAALVVSDTFGLSLVESLSGSDIQTGTDGNAFLGLEKFDSTVVYEEPHEVTVTNQTGVTLDDNQVSSAAGNLQFREPGTNNSSSTWALNNLASGQADSFEIVTAPDQTGKVTDTVTLSYSGSGVSIEIVRDMTVKFNAGGQLIYAMNGNIQVYDAVNNVLNEPAHTYDAEVIGANAVDIIAGSNADIPYLTGNKKEVYATWVSASSDQALGKGKKPKLKKKKTRLALGQWPPSSLSGELILSADNSASKILAIASDGSDDTLARPNDGCGGVAGVKDIDADGQVELVFVDGSQQIQYLEQDGTTHKIDNGGVGSNNSTGFGSPADFGRGKIEIPFIDGSQNPALIDSQGNKYTLNSSGVAKKAAVAPVDIDGDGKLEFMFLGNQSGYIKYIDDVGGTNNVETLLVNGSQVSPDGKIGLNSGA